MNNKAEQDVNIKFEFFWIFFFNLAVRAFFFRISMMKAGFFFNMTIVTS